MTDPKLKRNIEPAFQFSELFATSARFTFV